MPEAWRRVKASVLKRGRGTLRGRRRFSGTRWMGATPPPGEGSGGVGPPGVGVGGHVVHLDGGAHEAEALGFLDAVGEAGGLKALEIHVVATGGGDELPPIVASEDFRLEEGGLVGEVVAVHVVAGDFDGEDVLTVDEAGREVEFIGAVEELGAAGGTVGEKFAVEVGAVDGEGGEAEGDLVAGGFGEDDAVAGEDVHFGNEAGGVDGLGVHGVPVQEQGRGEIMREKAGMSIGWLNLLGKGGVGRLATNEHKKHKSPFSEFVFFVFICGQFFPWSVRQC